MILNNHNVIIGKITFFHSLIFMLRVVPMSAPSCSVTFFYLSLEMAPLKQSKHSKQGVLPLHMFCKNPSKSTTKKHASLEKKITAKPKPSKPRVDKKAAKRIAEEADLIRGAEKWHDFLEKIGIEDPASFRCDILYQSNGDAPDPQVYLKEKEDDNAEFQIRYDAYREH